MGILKLEYDLGFTHIVQASKGTMKRLEAISPIEINSEEYKNKKKKIEINRVELLELIKQVVTTK